MKHRDDIECGSQHRVGKNDNQIAIAIVIVVFVLVFVSRCLFPQQSTHQICALCATSYTHDDQFPRVDPRNMQSVKAALNNTRFKEWAEFLDKRRKAYEGLDEALE